MSSINQPATDSPALLDNDGRVPETRMANAADVTARVTRLYDADQRGRARRRALVRGLVDGNPPYRDSDLREAGRLGVQCNVNWRVAEYYLNSARSAFYDIFSETPTFATVTARTTGTDADTDVIWSNTVSEEFDRLLRQDEGWDYTMQISQYEMILFGIGPMVFCDDTDWRNQPALCRDLLVPEQAKSDPCFWDECAILKDYQPHELYAIIQNEESATRMGWNVEAVKTAIINAHPKREEGSQYRSWEWHQQQLKNASYEYSSQSEVIEAAHYLFREFPSEDDKEGAITHCIVLRQGASDPQDAFLFRKDRRFQSFLQIVHPMYYDNDGGGEHHSVTGLGVKMYSAMSFQNKLICNLADKVFAPKILFKPTTAAANEQWNMVQFGDYGRIPPNFDLLQTPVGSFAEEGLVLNRELTSLVSSNLSQYTQSLSKETGNPITATEAQYRASEQARLGKTQLNHYYNQLDRLYAEKFQRAIRCPSGRPGGREAAEFRKRCLDRGVPKAFLQECTAKATRIVGQGSQFMRQQALQQLLAIATMLPSEKGRANLISDFIASVAGQFMVERYNPTLELMQQPDDQQMVANLQIASARTGVQPVVTNTQNPMVFASAFISAAAQSLQSQSPEAIAFIQTIAPAAEQHLQRLATDPTRKEAAGQLSQTWNAVVQQAQQMGQAMEQRAQQQQQQAQEMQPDPMLAVKAAETQAKLAMQQQKTNAAIAMKQQKHDQDLLLKDATTAASIRRQNQTATTP